MMKNGQCIKHLWGQMHHDFISISQGNNLLDKDVNSLLMHIRHAIEWKCSHVCWNIRWHTTASVNSLEIPKESCEAVITSLAMVTCWHYNFRNCQCRHYLQSFLLFAHLTRSLCTIFGEPHNIRHLKFFALSCKMLPSFISSPHDVQKWVRPITVAFTKPSLGEWYL